jgi:hypothetical protein
MAVAILVLVFLDAAVVGLLAWRVQLLNAREQSLRSDLALLAPAPVLPVALEEAFAGGPRRVLTVEILNPLELAKAQHKLAGVASGFAPSAVRALVYDQAAKITRVELAKHGVAADVQIHVAS